MYHITNFVEAEKALEPFWPPRMKQQRVAYVLDHVVAFLDYIGNPQDTVQAIHIAGTSGKTSTAYYAAALLTAAGKKVGLLTSPHIEQLNERVQINLQPLPEKQFCAELSIFMDSVKASKEMLTYAEILYAFAFWEFARQGVDCIVVEVGLGGLLDATNVISRSDKICVITDIGLDHTNVLGNTIAEIAAQKAGIIKLHNTVVCYRQNPVVLQVIEQACRQKKAGLQVISDPSEQEPQSSFQFLPLFQQRNFTLALAAANMLFEQNSGKPLSAKQILAAAQTYIPGRMEVRKIDGKTVILDGAHNAQKLEALRKSVASGYPGQPVALLVAITARRELAALLAEIAPFHAHLIATEGPRSDTHEWHSASDIAAAARHAGIQSVEVIPDYTLAYQALIKRSEPILLATGSLYLYHYIRPLAQ